jgi:hypothetical protein
MTVYILFIRLRTGTGKTECYEKNNETLGSKNGIEFKVFKSVHHHKIQINDMI